MEVWMDIETSIEGIQRSVNLLEQAARKLSDPNLEKIHESMVDQTKGEIMFAANAAVLKTVDELQKYTIDILA